MKRCYTMSGGNIRWCFIVAAPSVNRVNRRDTAIVIGVAALWGFNFVVIDWGMGTVPPLLFAAIRFSVVSLACFFVPRPTVPLRTVAAVGAFMSLGQFASCTWRCTWAWGPGWPRWCSTRRRCSRS